jgi:hypothetical protein
MSGRPRLSHAIGIRVEDSQSWLDFSNWQEGTSMNIVLRLNEWLNANAPLVKRAIRAIVSIKTRNRFAEQKFRATIDNDSYDVIFRNIYLRNWWGSTESISGCGSEFHRTSSVRRGLVEWCLNNHISSIFDAPCGDFNWMKDVVCRANLMYLGGDIVPELIQKNEENREDRCSFVAFDILNDSPPNVEAWLCRDVLFHFPNAAIERVLERFKNSNIRFLLTTHFEKTTSNSDIDFGRYRPVNLCYPPFNWPRPIYLISDGDEKEADRCLGVWENPKYQALSPHLGDRAN